MLTLYVAETAEKHQPAELTLQERLQPEAAAAASLRQRFKKRRG